MRAVNIYHIGSKLIHAWNLCLVIYHRKGKWVGTVSFMVVILLQDKVSQLFLNVISCVVWEKRIEHLRNCIVDTWMFFSGGNTVVVFQVLYHFSYQEFLFVNFLVFGHVSFESTRSSTWVTAFWALVWFFSGVNAEVGFQMLCSTEWAPTLFTEMWLLSAVGEQMSGKIWFCDRREVAPFALIWLF